MVILGTECITDVAMLMILGAMQTMVSVYEVTGLERMLEWSEVESFHFVEYTVTLLSKPHLAVTKIFRLALCVNTVGF